MKCSKHFLPVIVGIAIVGVLAIGFLVLGNVRNRDTMHPSSVQKEIPVDAMSSRIPNGNMPRNGESAIPQQSTDSVEPIMPVGADTSLDVIEKELEETVIAEEYFENL